jgi:hypothetical protein
MEELAKVLKRQRQKRSKYRLLVISTEICLLLLGLNRTQKILTLFSKKRHENDPIPLDHLLTIFNQIRNHHFLKGKCLSQSLALQLILRRAGYETALKIGGKKDDKVGIALHAWLEMEGKPLNDHGYVVAEYTPFSPFNIA